MEQMSHFPASKNPLLDVGLGRAPVVVVVVVASTTDHSGHLVVTVLRIGATTI